MLKFWKYHGTGNDFVMLDGFSQVIEDRAELARKMCDRHFGIGSDGLIVIEPDDHADFHMDFYNPDGSVSFCGNGSRCAVAFANFLGKVTPQCTFRAVDGLHTALINGNEIAVSMRDTSMPEVRENHYILNTGSPHYVIFTENVRELDLIRVGRDIRYNEEFATHGINVNVVEQSFPGIRMRTYERGVEAETLSCGTGVTAAALAATITLNMQPPIMVQTAGGELHVDFKQSTDLFQGITLSGPAVQVFHGEFPC
jgi:diaminopimelate epimerase